MNPISHIQQKAAEIGHESEPENDLHRELSLVVVVVEARERDGEGRDEDAGVVEAFGEHADPRAEGREPVEEGAWEEAQEHSDRGGGVGSQEPDWVNIFAVGVI